MAHHFGVRPWEIDLLTDGEVREFLDRLDKLQKQTSKQGGR